MEQGQVQWRIRGRVVIPLVRIVRDCNEDYLLGSQDTAEQKVRERTSMAAIVARLARPASRAALSRRPVARN